MPRISPRSVWLLRAGGGLCRGRPGASRGGTAGEALFSEGTGRYKSVCRVWPGMERAARMSQPGFFGNRFASASVPFLSMGCGAFFLCPAVNRPGAGLRAPSGHGGAWAASGRGGRDGVFPRHFSVPVVRVGGAFAVHGGSAPKSEGEGREPRPFAASAGFRPRMFRRKKKPRLFGKAGPRVTCFCCGIRTGAGRCRIFSPCSSRCGSSTSSRARP